VAYANIELILKNMGGLLPSEESQEAEWVNTLIDMTGLRDITSISIMFPLKEGESFRAFVHAPDFSGVLPLYFSASPIDWDITSVMPADTDGMMGLSVQPPIDMYTSTLRLIEKFNPQFTIEEFESSLAGIEEQLGFSIKDDFLRSLGQTLALGITIDTDLSPSSQS